MYDVICIGNYAEIPYDVTYNNLRCEKSCMM